MSRPRYGLVQAWTRPEQHGPARRGPRRDASLDGVVGPVGDHAAVGPAVPEPR